MAMKEEKKKRLGKWNEGAKNFTYKNVLWVKANFINFKHSLFILYFEEIWPS